MDKVENSFVQFFFQLVPLDNLKRRGSELNIPRLKSTGINFIHGDIRVPEDLEQAGRVDILIDCAAEPSIYFKIQCDY